MGDERLMRLNGRIDMIGVMRRLCCQKEFIALGLYRGQFGILEYVAKNPGCTQKQIADHMAITASSVAKSTARMQRAGMLEKKIDEKNLRCNKLYITEAGRRVSEQTREMFIRLDQKMFSGFSESEIEVLEKSLDRVIDNLAEDSDDIRGFDFEKMCSLHKKLRENEKDGG